MSLALFQSLHVTSFMMIFAALGAIIFGANPRFIPTISVLNIVGLLAFIISGIALITQTPVGIDGATPFTAKKAWIVQIVIWLMLAASLPVAKSKMLHEGQLITVVLLLGAASAFLGIAMPF